MSHLLILFLLLLFLYISFGHPESLAPPNKYSSQYRLSTGNGGTLSSGYRSSLITYANIQHINCFSTVNTNTQRYDIAILGAPFDTSTTGRPGARFGPHGIRLGSRRINPVFGYDPYTHKNSLTD
jgi:agmatinase